MRRLGRWMLNALTVLSLLLSLGTATLWVRSYFMSESLSSDTYTGVAILETGRGNLGLSHDKNMNGRMIIDPFNPRLTYFRHAPMDPPLILSQYPYLPNHRVNYGPVRWVTTAAAPNTWFQSTLVLPFSLVTAVPLLVAWCGCSRLWRRARRAGAGRCAECGYDLTGNVSGVCPECGTEIAN